MRGVVIARLLTAVVVFGAAVGAGALLGHAAADGVTFGAVFAGVYLVVGLPLDVMRFNRRRAA
ncbi:MAG: hypothetical protein QOF67_435 [Mycobacterium sp.]|jgi:carbonic anhydrase/acetyltransferase-like protein (isoleucine patch superfamily)|nr:hypothetical protein [Mycobacterium sp.]